MQTRSTDIPKSRKIKTGYSYFVFVLMVSGVVQAYGAERTDKIFMQGNPAGTQTVKEEAGGVVRVEYSYNDRGTIT
jgi:hypothetical protein